MKQYRKESNTGRIRIFLGRDRNNTGARERERERERENTTGRYRVFSGRDKNTTGEKALQGEIGSFQEEIGTPHGFDQPGRIYF